MCVRERERVGAQGEGHESVRERKHACVMKEIKKFMCVCRFQILFE